MTAAAGLAITATHAAGRATAAPNTGPVTINHAFGQTVVPSPPKRVVSAGFTEQDDLLSVGVVPIATTEWFGNEPFAVWPWAQGKLGGAQPTVLSIYDGIQVDQIAALKPDLIVATNAGVNEDTYQQLSAIAPTIPQSGAEPFFEPWKLQANAIGEAVFQADRMRSVIAGVDGRFAAVAKKYPQFAGKKVFLLSGNTFWQDSVIAAIPSWKTEFLTQMGFVIPAGIAAYSRGDDRAYLDPNDPAPLDEADVLIWKTESQADIDALLAIPGIANLPATRENRNVFTTNEQAGAIAFCSPLSLPFVADQLPPLLAKALH
ncbi:ABC-type Fe3+-hydroxamate transport system, periplasmic component [Mycobacterium sp. JS623]|nr:ABC-type Fe3+-hydroxamate transport system, periplasmic component [Mycobacterium sp. JS623]